MSETLKQYGLAAQVTASFRRRRIWPGLRMAPMIDVIFLLLTFFVLTVQFERPEQALPLVFGAAAAQPASEPKPLELAIAQDSGGCAVTLEKGRAVVILYETPLAGLTELAEQVHRTTEAGARPIQIQCDEAVPWDLVTKIYDVLYGMGARDITFVVGD